MRIARKLLRCFCLVIACFAGAGPDQPSAAASPPSDDDISRRLDAALEAIEWLKRDQERSIAHARIREGAVSLFLGLEMCQPAYRLLRFDPDNPAATPYIRARLLQIGLCAQHSPREAIAFLHRALDRPYIRALAYARLGEAYFTGHGARQDLHRADQHFKLALFARGWALADPFIRNEDVDLVELFGDVFEPSWHPSDPFLSTFEKLRAQLAGNPSAIVEFALSHCDLDTPPCAHAAFDWIYATAEHFDDPDAHYHYANLVLESQIPEARLAARPISPGTSPSRTVREADAAIALVTAGQAGHVAAIERLITLLRSRPRGAGRDKALYFWTLRLQRLGSDATAPEYESLPSILSTRQKASVEEMEKRITACCLPPLDWHFPAQFGQPRD